jgi:lambda repressor-like predicted transcriptional regulator
MTAAPLPDWTPGPDRVARRRTADYAPRRYQLNRAGQWAPFTHTGPVREHLQVLREAGVTLDQIGRVAGVSVATLSRAARKPRMTSAAADAIMAIPVPTAYPDQRPGATAAEKLRTLIADGWTLVQIAEATGLSDRALHRQMHEQVPPMRGTVEANRPRLRPAHRRRPRRRLHRRSSPGSGRACRVATQHPTTTAGSRHRRHHRRASHRRRPTPTAASRAARRAEPSRLRVPRRRDRPPPQRQHPHHAEASQPQPATRVHGSCPASRDASAQTKTNVSSETESKARPQSGTNGRHTSGMCVRCFCAAVQRLGSGRRPK